MSFGGVENEFCVSMLIEVEGWCWKSDEGGGSDERNKETKNSQEWMAYLYL